MKSRLLLIALLTSFSVLGQDIIVNGQTIGRFLDGNERRALKPFTRQLSNGNYIRNYKGFKVELYPSEQIDRIVKLNKVANISFAVCVPLVAAYTIEGKGTMMLWVGMMIGVVLYAAAGISIRNKIKLNRYIRGKTRKQRG